MQNENVNTWGCSSSVLAISQQEAEKIILSGETLCNAQVDKIEITGKKLEGIQIENCVIGSLNLQGCVVNKPVTFKNTTFTEKVELSDTDFKGEVRQTKFNQNVIVDNCLFEKELFCRRAQLAKEIIYKAKSIQDIVFDYTVFRGDITTNGSYFEKTLSAIECLFLGYVSFREITVDGDFLLRRNTFEKKINIGRTSVGGSLYLNNSSCASRLGINGFSCEGEVALNDSKFLGELAGKGMKVGKRFSLFNSLVEGDLKLDESVFMSEFNLKNAVLRKMFRAPKATFAKRVVLDGLRSEGILLLNDLVFEGDFLCRYSFLQGNEEEINFSHTQFCKGADFHKTLFYSSSVDFSECIFEQKTSFRDIQMGTESGIAKFTNCTFNNRLGFDHAIFSAKLMVNNICFKKRVGFDSCIFHQNIDFTDSNFLDTASFQSTHFLKQALFYGSNFTESDFLNAEFESSVLFSIEQHVAAKLNPETVEQKPCNFTGKTSFTNVRFNKKAIFQKVVFADEVSFSNAYFGEQVSFRKAQFEKDAIFSGIYCSLELDLRKIRVKQELALKGANINRRLNLADATFANVALYNIVTDIISISPDQIEGKLRGHNLQGKESDVIDITRSAQEYLILKNSFSLQGMHQEEDWAYWQFRRFSRKASSMRAKKEKKPLTLLRNVFEKLFIDYGSHYGTHPFRITFLAFFLIIMFGCFYWLFPDQLILEGREIGQQDTPSITQCIYFSVMAFTTMGFGDVHPDFHGWLKGFVALEALIGIFTMTLFVGTYARKIVR